MRTCRVVRIINLSSPKCNMACVLSVHDSKSRCYHCHDMKSIINSLVSIKSSFSICTKIFHSDDDVIVIISLWISNHTAEMKEFSLLTSKILLNDILLFKDWLTHCACEFPNNILCLTLGWKHYKRSSTIFLIGFLKRSGALPLNASIPSS